MSTVAHEQIIQRCIALGARREGMRKRLRALGKELWKDRSMCDCIDRPCNCEEPPCDSYRIFLADYRMIPDAWLLERYTREGGSGTWCLHLFEAVVTHGLRQSKMEDYFWFADGLWDELGPVSVVLWEMRDEFVRCRMSMVNGYLHTGDAGGWGDDEPPVLTWQVFYRVWERRHLAMERLAGALALNEDSI